MWHETGVHLSANRFYTSSMDNYGEGALHKSRGFTLVEVLITLSVLAILAATVIPSMSDYIDKRRVIKVAEAVYGELLYARSEAIARSSDVVVAFSTNGTTTWSVGMSSLNSPCNPTQTTLTASDACVLVVDDGDGNVHNEPDGNGGTVTDSGDLVRRVLSSADYPGITMGGLNNNNTPNNTSDDTLNNTVSFSGGVTRTTFNSVRGTAGAGTVVVRLGNQYEMRIKVSLIGRVSICTPSGTMQVGGYSAC